MSEKVNKQNLVGLCWKKGFRGVTGLAKHIGKSRVTVHRALANPRRFGPTHRKIVEVLNG